MSSETKHTPGPWEDAEYPVVFAPYPKDSVAMVEVANCMLDRDIFDQWQANARLIAAAPELLEACKAVDEWLMEGFADSDADDPVYNEAFRRALRTVRAAIARATGQEG